MFFILLSVICFVLFDRSARAASSSEVSDNPTAANFLRRAFHGARVLGNFLFIDGGQFSQLINGEVDVGQGEYGANSRANVNHSWCEDNVTLSIDLRESWTNSSLVIKTISKHSAPVFDNPKLWTSPDGTSFYLWSGLLNSLGPTVPPPASSLWKFTSDESGSGSWSQETIDYAHPSSDSSEQPSRPDGFGCGITLGDTGYYVGGRVSAKSDPYEINGYFQKTTTSYNMTSGVWNNKLYTKIGTTGAIIGASAGGVSAIGLDGRPLIVLIGGRDPGTDAKAKPANYISFDNVTLYDPYIDRWYAQKASGEIPAFRELFCAVTVPGDNGTFEIFIYGGVNQMNWEVYADMYILTIPGFVWFKVPARRVRAKRHGHTCEPVGGRQLMSIGGIDNPQDGKNYWYDWTIPDSFIQGIGVFDMTALTWKSGYDADAAPYQSPTVVKDWYSRGNQDSVQWQSLEIARMFIQDIPVSVNPTPAPTSPGSTSANSSTTSLSDKDAIGLGVGLGVGLPGLLGTFLGVWITWRQYRRKTGSGSAHHSDQSLAQLSGSPPSSGTPTQTNENISSVPTTASHQLSPP
ncbi:hypothetical protein K402DRAFT_55465 [Aulographum hederae CBS 113979]|uniref:Kelch repeat protein n=1 Tax=Aulographum hederae CBS 113979 TaxID=1176131 RepID=A0A6G1H2G6_9PEZI|nr:hypothetical protein K402DRAFT_55465 [Aulographum hederae CBS 113979]